jgi:glycerophosphoryl diester phosphodiesterase
MTIDTTEVKTNDILNQEKQDNLKDETENEEKSTDIFDTWVVNKLIAHRGFHDEQRPENSISAFENAINHDYGIELDIYPLEDGTPVVFHDATMMRMTGKDGYIRKIKNVEELKTYTLLNEKGEDTGEKIPTLQETLDFVGGRTPMLIEIKDYNINSNFERTVYDILKKYKGDFAIMSFNPYTLRWFRQNAPEILRGQLASSLKNEKMSIIKKWILKRMALNKTHSQPNFIAYKWDEVPNRYVRKYKQLPLLVWAVPSQSAYMKVAKYCDNIIFEGFEPRI